MFLAGLALQDSQREREVDLWGGPGNVWEVWGTSGEPLDCT